MTAVRHAPRRDAGPAEGIAAVAPQPDVGRRNRSPLRALRHRSLAIYTVGNLLSNCGAWFQGIASVILADRLSHGSTFVVSVVVFSQFAAVIVLAPWAGSAADRFDRRRMLITVSLLAAVFSAGLGGLQGAGLVNVPVLIGMTLVLGTTTAFAAPALKAMVPSLVPSELVGDAIAVDSATFNIARAIGPVLGAAVYEAVGPAWAFGVNAGSFLALVVALGLLESTPRPLRPGRSTLRSSLRLLRGDPLLMASLGVVTAVSISSDPVNTLGPALSRAVGRPATTTGLLLGALGAGAGIAAFTLSPRRTDPGRRVVLLCVLMGVATLVVACAPNLAVALPALLVVGFGFLAAQTQATTTLQLGVADDQRGRLMALWAVAFLGTRPLAAIVDGAVASLWGVRFATAVMAMPVLGAAIWMATVVRRLRHERERLTVVGDRR